MALSRTSLSKQICSLFYRKFTIAMKTQQLNPALHCMQTWRKLFDKVPHYELIQKVSKRGIGGCLLEVLKDYFTDRYQIVRCGNERSDQLLITSGVPQGSVIGPLMFLIFINDLPKYLIYSEPFLYADDLKSLVINNKEIFQLDLDNLTKWGVENRMSFAVKDLKCFIVTFRGTTEEQFYLSNLPLLGLTSAKDLGLMVTSNLSWSTHIGSKIRKANTVFFFIKRNTSATQIRVRLILYKSMLLPILSFACCCFGLSRTSLKLLEKFQKRVLKWVCRDYHSIHKELLLKCNLLPVPSFFQLKNLLFLSKYFHELRFTGVDLNITTTMSKKGRMMFDLKTARPEKARAEFCFRMCRLANKLPERVAFFEPLGLKNRILVFMWQYFHQLYLEDQLCTYQIYCDCQNCRNRIRIF